MKKYSCFFKISNLKTHFENGNIFFFIFMPHKSALASWPTSLIYIWPRSLLRVSFKIYKCMYVGAYIHIFPSYFSCTGWQLYKKTKCVTRVNEVVVTFITLPFPWQHILRPSTLKQTSESALRITRRLRNNKI